MINEQSPDEQIIKSVLQKDVNCFRYIVDRYQKLIFSIGMRLFKNESDTWDFVQEVFIKAYCKLSSYLGKGPFRFWLISIAYNHGINCIRSKNYSETLDQNCYAISKEISSETICIQKEVREILLKAIGTLPEKYKICVDFYFFLGLSYGEISQITGFPVNTIKSHVFRAKQILRDVLRGTIVEEDYHDV